MKWLCALLAIMVLMLSVQPVCASVSGVESCCESESCENSPIQTSNDDDHSEDDCNNGCNPFQLCGCCAFSVVTPVNQVFITSALLPIVHSKAWTNLSVQFPDGPVSGFWQPPRGC